MNGLVTSIEKPSRVRYGVLGFACILSMITYLDRVCFGTVASNIQGEFGLDDGEKGFLFTAFAFAYAIFEVPSGWLGDRYGARRTLVRIVLWWSVFTAVTGLVSESGLFCLSGLWLLIIIRFLFGMDEAGAYPNITRLVNGWFPFRERGLAQGVVWMSARLGGAVSYITLGALTTWLGWRQGGRWLLVGWA